MGVIKLDKDFLDLKGKVLYGHKECCIQKPDGKLAKSDGVLVLIKVPTPKDKLELKKVCITSLLKDFDNDTPEFKTEKYLLFQKFHKASGKIDLEAKDVVLVKNQIARVYSTFVMGQAFDMLEGK